MVTWCKYGTLLATWSESLRLLLSTGSILVITTKLSVSAGPKLQGEQPQMMFRKTEVDHQQVFYHYLKRYDCEAIHH